MPARLTVHLPERAAQSRLLRDGDRLRVGRSGDCGLCLDHPSISRSHADLLGRGGSWSLHDLGSKNGTHVDGRAVDSAELTRDCWLRLGDLYCEFELVDDAVAASEDARRDARRARATALTVGLRQATGFPGLLESSLRAVIELAQCQRGFLLLRDEDGYAIRAQQAIDPRQLASRSFSGSAGAVDRCLREGVAVVVNDIGDEAWLAERASVVAGNLRALVCIPLSDGDHPFGAIYADRSGPGAAITTLDLELLQAFAERAALYIVARQASDALAASDVPRWEPRAAPRMQAP